MRAGAAKAAPVRVIELLYFDGCPHYQEVLAHVRDLLRGCGVNTRVQLRRIPDESSAVRERFLGSPTVRVDGRDVEPGASERSDFGMQCRFYATEAGLLPKPLDNWVLDALQGPTS